GRSTHGSVVDAGGVGEEGSRTRGSVPAANGVGAEGPPTRGGVKGAGGVGEEGFEARGSVRAANGDGVERFVTCGSVREAGSCKIARARADEGISATHQGWGWTGRRGSVKNGNPADADDACVGVSCARKEQASVHAQTTVYGLITVAVLCD